MLRWAQDGIRELALDDIGEHYGRYRLHLPEAERAMARSLERYGQISPMVVCLQRPCLPTALTRTWEIDGVSGAQIALVEAPANR